MAGSSIITFHKKGDFRKLSGFLEKAKHLNHNSILDEYGKRGVEALMLATPVDTGKTAMSWRYEIQNTESGVALSFHNDNSPTDYVNIAIILQYGHGTGTGGWVEGRNYINPAIRPIFDDLAKKAWEETIRV